MAFGLPMSTLRKYECLHCPNQCCTHWKCGEACYYGEVNFISSFVKQGTAYVYLLKTGFQLPGSYWRSSAAWGHHPRGAP